MTDNADAVTPSPKTIGFWSCWALSVGTMVGSGIFMLPAVLAPYGLLSFGGWLLTATGSIAIALVIGRLASRTGQPGGIYAYAHNAFGDLAGFLTAWMYWLSTWTSASAIVVGFVGYVTVFAPALATHPVYQLMVGLALIWTLTAISLRGARDAGVVQLVMTGLKLIPLLIIILLGALSGNADNLPPANPTGGSPLAVLTTTALLTMWAFLGLEAGAVPALNVRNPQKTMPRAVVIGTITVASLYISSTAAVMLLVPAEVLATSSSPFADAARGLGEWAPILVALGALISTAGAANGTIFVAGQMPMAAALDGLAPKIFGRLNKGGAPWASLILTSTLASVLLALNYYRGLVGAFTFLLMMATATALAPYLIWAIAELRHSWRDARNWALIALIAAVYSLFALYGSGLEILGWGALVLVLGVPVYMVLRRGRERSTATG
ncbi:MAG: amino acid permease [Hyphomonadaceae bacterium]